MLITWQGGVTKLGRRLLEVGHGCSLTVFSPLSLQFWPGGMGAGQPLSLAPGCRKPPPPRSIGDALDGNVGAPAPEGPLMGALPGLDFCVIPI